MVILELGLVLLQEEEDILDRIHIQVSPGRLARVVTQAKLLPAKVILVKLPDLKVVKVIQANSIKVARLLAKDTQDLPRLLAKAIQVQVPRLRARVTRVQVLRLLASSTRVLLPLVKAKATQVVSKPQILKLHSGSMQWTKTDPDKLTARNCRRHWSMEIGLTSAKKHAG